MNEKYRIVVDAGHGGVDPGAVQGNLLEKDLNLQAANYMYKRFQELGVPVIITRSDDANLTRSERINLMKSLGTDPNVIILSNHINAGGGEGAEVVYPLRTSSVLPRMILDEIGAKGQIKRKIYQRVLPENPSKDYYYIMRDTPNATTLLIEYGFIDNPRDQVKLQNNLEDYAEGVVKAVSEYIGIPYIEKNNTEEGGLYTVKKGDTLYSIASKYNTTVSQIKELNNLDSDNLNIGEILKIPTSTITEEYSSYTVIPGDTLYSIANKYGITINDLLEYNNLGTTLLSVNQVLKIPNNSLEENTYIVKRGDTLYSISQITNSSIDEIKVLNNLTNNTLYIGQKLRIPIKTIEETDYIVYSVKPGDTLYSIAREYNSSVNSIKAYNNLENDLLKVNQILQIPVSSITTNYQTYQIEPGDTLYSIARRFNKTVNELLDFNNLNTNLLQIGQTIKIPY